MEPFHQHAAYDGDATDINLVRRTGSGSTRGTQWTCASYEPDFREYTPLMLAAYKGHDAAVDRLLAFGADVEQQSVLGLSACGWTAAHWRAPAISHHLWHCY